MSFLAFVPALLFIFAAIAELILCVYALHSGRTKIAGVLVLLFQNIGSQRLIRHGAPIPTTLIPFESRLQNITFGTTSCCFGFTHQIKCLPMPVHLPTLDLALHGTKLRDVQALKAISSGVVLMSLVWVVVLTTLLVTTVSLVFGYQNIKFLGGLRKFGRSLKALVLLFSVTLGSFLLLPLVYPRQVSWEMRKIDGVAVLSGPVSGIVFAALCCFIAMTFCASFICSWDL